VHLGFVIRDHQIQLPVGIIIAECSSHPRPCGAVAGDGDARHERRLGEPSFAVVVEQEVGHSVVGDEDVRPLIVIVIADRDAKPVAQMPGDAGPSRHIGERSLPII
jgi:hypothetical protein